MRSSRRRDGRLVVNNASALGPSPQPAFADYPLETFAVYKVDLLVPLALIQAVLRPSDGDPRRRVSAAAAGLRAARVVRPGADGRGAARGHPFRWSAPGCALGRLLRRRRPGLRLRLGSFRTPRNVSLPPSAGEVLTASRTDPERVAIVGGSYGGYSALVGATFTPEVFRCAISFAGPSNLKTLLENIPPYWTPIAAQLHRRVGDPETEEAFLWSRSPLARVEAIQIPIFIVQGANDPRVTPAESEQIVAAMRDKGLDHEYVLLADEGHTLVKPENRLRVTAATERFHAKHLGGRCEQ